MSAKTESLDVLGLRIDRVTTIEVLGRIKESVEAKKRLVISTPNSEFVIRGLRDQEYRRLINSSDINVADGSGIQWAANFFARPLRPKLISWVQAIVEGLETLSLKHASRLIPERIPGSRLTWDIASFSAKNGYRIYLLGGVGGVAERTTKKLQQRNPKLVIAGYGEGSRSGDEKAQAADIFNAEADIVLVAFGSPYQEEWISKTSDLLPSGVFVGVGGTFDFIAGGAAQDGGQFAKFFPARRTPAWIEKIGLSFLWRLLTQPWRLKRIWRAAPYFMYKVVQYKAKQT
jgi:N-acetylglucosaminyldiphosphoundecaprenol N-acetyl-beta-D-mannosaminyltransferase